MMVYTFPIINALIGTTAFDLKTFGYSLEEAKTILQNLDSSTIKFYLFPQLTFLDLLYPALLAFFLNALLVRLVMLHTIEFGTILTILRFLPLLAMTFNYLENITISILITDSLILSQSIIKMASTFTQLKSLFISLSWLSIFTFFGQNLWTRYYIRRSQQED
ncbi:MAG: hypothetical protein ACI9DJ_001972 [Algoriphagus sp.]|jgi:hypothetical protein